RHELSGSVSRFLDHSRGGPPGTPATHRQRDVDAVSRDCGEEDNGGWPNGRGNGRTPGLLGVSSRTLMEHSYRVIRRMRYGTDSTRERHNDRGGPSSDTA